MAELKRSITTAEGELSELEKQFDSKKAEYKDALKKLTEAQEEVPNTEGFRPPSNAQLVRGDQGGATTLISKERLKILNHRRDTSCLPPALQHPSPPQQRGVSPARSRRGCCTAARGS